MQPHFLFRMFACHGITIEACTTANIKQKTANIEPSNIQLQTSDQGPPYEGGWGGAPVCTPSVLSSLVYLVPKS